MESDRNPPALAGLQLAAGFFNSILESLYHISSRLSGAPAAITGEFDSGFEVFVGNAFHPVAPPIDGASIHATIKKMIEIGYGLAGDMMQTVCQELLNENIIVFK